MAQVWGEVPDTARRGGLMRTQEGMSWVVWRDPSCPPGPGGEPGGLESCSSPQTFICGLSHAATGYTRAPYTPPLAGLEQFGPVIHSSEYRNGAAWTGRRVLVVGFGNSGGEIAIDDMKLALLLNAMDRRIGGVLLRGQKGSAKTTLARAQKSLRRDLSSTRLPGYVGWKLNEFDSKCSLFIEFRHPSSFQNYNN